MQEGGSGVIDELRPLADQVGARLEALLSTLEGSYGRSDAQG